MGRVFGSDGDITSTDGARQVWSNTRRPAVLLPSAAVVLSELDIAFPDFDKANIYGFDIVTSGPFTSTSCAAFTTVIPQSWDSGLTAVASVPSSSNYYEVQINLQRIVSPSDWLGIPIAKGIDENVTYLLDGAACRLERFGQGVMSRMVSFERIGNTIYMRRKQSVRAIADPAIWTPGNAVYTPGGGKYEGWTWGGQPNAWPAHLIETKGPGGGVNKERGGSNACSLSDTSNYASTWRGTVTITPGYIKP